MTDDRNLHISEAAQLLCVSESVVKRLIHDGKLLSYKIGSRRVVPYSAVQDYIAERKRLAALEADETADLRRNGMRRVSIRRA